MRPPFDDPPAVHAWFDHWAAATPDACALAVATAPGAVGRVSYGDLDRQANQLVHVLATYGVRPGDVVAICLPRSRELVAGILAVLKAGAAALPLDPRSPRARLGQLLRDSRATVLLSDRPGLTDDCPVVDPSSSAGRSSQQPGVEVRPDDLAFLLYTSGSTGAPKGVQTLHRNWVHSTRARMRYYGEPLTGLMFGASFSSDAAMGALLWTLSTGATFVIAGEQTACDPCGLVRLIARERPSHTVWVPSLYEQVLRQASATDLEALRVVILGGEVLRSDLVEAHTARLPSTVLYNEYGPTEATVWSTVHRCGSDPDQVPIGGPVPGARIVLLGPDLAPVGHGEPGEICIGGEGLARGYLDRPELTAERFVELPGLGRLYRSGDRGRLRPDGALEFLGRVDNQVKLSGFRIELEEIESVLGSEDGVAHVAAAGRTDGGGAARLVAYVEPSPEAREEAARSLLDQWRHVDDAIYGQAPAPDDPAFNIIGWNDSYRHEPIPPDQMREWVHHTVERVAALLPSRGARVVELGCGSGLLLFQLAPFCGSYLGTDISQRALDSLAEEIAGTPGLRGKVSLRRAAAHDVTDIPDGSADVVVLNSVTQFFPSGDYLREVLDNAVRAVAPGGAVFVGDIRPLASIRAFHAGVALARSPADLTVADLRARTDRAVEDEEELLVDPGLFGVFAEEHPLVSRIEIQLKRGHAANEMTRFRYDVVIHVGPRPGPRPVLPELTWGREVSEPADVLRRLEEDAPPRLVVRNVPNSRLADEARLLEVLADGSPEATAGALRDGLGLGRRAGVDPELWRHRAARMGFQAQLVPGTDPCRYDLVLTRDGVVPDPGLLLGEGACANRPWWGWLTRGLSRALRERAERQLPPHMVPSAFVVLDRMPRTVTGKIDRAALPAPMRGAGGSSRVRLRSDLERRIAEVWREVLPADEPGGEDNFFDLGGTSLLLMQVQARLRDLLGRDIDVITLLRNTTIASLAGALAGGAANPRPAPAPGPPARAADEPIAVIGMACRLPGASNVEEFWRNLRAGVDSITRPVGVPGERRVRAAGVLDGIEMFDASLFGYSPAEAARLDPQQRLYLECVHCAFAHAGHDPHRFRGSVGVWCGSDFNTYFLNNVHPSRRCDGPRTFLETVEDMNLTMANAPDFLASRVSYKFGLQGPSIAVQTACSTSLVAVHLASEALRAGACDMALAGGVSVRVPQGRGYVFEEGSILSPDGVCRPFDAAANGTVFSSGLGVVVLRRLADAIADRDTVHAVITGSAVNNDGSVKAGFAAPSVEGQQTVITQALARAGAAPDTIGYVEAHGTGTRLGDVVELTALAEVYGQGARRPRSCAVGSVKANIGHVAHAAGVAGLIKAVLAVHHGELPAHPHFDQPHHLLESETTPLFVNTEPLAWGDAAAPRRAAVSSFGMGGTNAHVIVEQAPRQPERSRQPERTAHLLTLSARTARALSALTTEFAEVLAGTGDAAAPDLCATANAGRRVHEHRTAVTARTAAGLREALLQSVPSPPPTRPPRVAFLFPGQGAQYPAMGADLYDSAPVFREALDRCAAVLGMPLADILYRQADESGLAETDLAQPVLLSIELALAALWRSWGVEPAAVVGHSLGEFAAAVIAGVMSLEDALHVVAHRGRLMAQTPVGAMATVKLSTEAAEQLTHGYDVTIAAVNGPERVVISGAVEAVDALCARAGGVEIRRLPTRHAFHSPAMDPVLDPFARVMRGVPLSRPSITFVSTLTGAVVDSEVTRAGYWTDQARRPVLLQSAMRTLREQDIDVFIEVGPGLTMLSAGQLCLPGQDGWLASMRQGARAAWPDLLESLGTLFVRGATVDLSAIERGFTRNRVRLPGHPFQRERCWIAPPAARDSHPLLGARLDLPAEDGIRFEARLSLDDRDLRYLADHRIDDSVIFPLTGYAEIMVAAWKAVGGAGTPVIHDLVVERPNEITGPGRLQTLLRPDGGRSWSVQIHHRPDEGAQWVRHAAGHVTAGEQIETPALDLCRRRCPAPVPAKDLYARLRKRGLAYGPSFQAVDKLWVGSGAALALLRMPTRLTGQAALGLHPALLDACFHALDLVVPDGAFVPLAMERLACDPDRTSDAVWAFAERLSGHGDRSPVCAVSVLAEDGTPLASCRGLTLRPFGESSADLDRYLYGLGWARSAPAEAVGPAAGEWILFGNPDGVAGALRETLTEAGHQAAVYEREQDLHARLGAADPIAHVVHLRGLECGDGEVAETRPSLMSGPVRGWDSALAITQAVAASGCRPRLWIVTRGAEPAGGPAPVAVQQAPLTGLARAVALEHPELRCTTIDLDPFGDDRDAMLLGAELRSDDTERQVAYRDGQRLVARLARTRPAPAPPTVTRPFRIDGSGRSLDEIFLRPLERRPPGPGELEIEVRAAGLNLRDVLTAVGGLAARGGAFGYECAGVVSRVGADVPAHVPGDAVIALTRGSLATHVTTCAQFVARKPAGLTFEQAATLPAAFLTAFHALTTMAGLTEGERVLIHAAAGGVGQAAVQVAHHLGAQVIGTASRGKWAALAASGVATTLSSRTPGFAEALADHARVDVVLNSLNRDLARAGLDVLAEGGRFVELGRRDVLTGAEIRALRPDVRQHAFDLGEISERAPDVIAGLFSELLPLFESGVLAPLPYRAFPMTEAANAFRWMAGGQHIGKVVLSCTGNSRPVRPDGAYVVTGGIGGIGLEVARWLRDQGATDLVLATRRAADHPVAVAARDRLEAPGVRVRVIQADLSCPADAQRLVEQCADRAPLRGVVHCAAVREDGLIQHQTVEAFERALAAKADGAWNLHRLTRGAPVEFFVLFSSAASLLGAAGQAPYAAANAALDALAHHRRALGLHALSVNWGAWDGVGMMTRLDPAHQARLAALGAGRLSVEEGLNLLGRFLARDLVQVAALPIDWSRWLSAIPANIPLYDQVRPYADEARRHGRTGRKRTVEDGLTGWTRAESKVRTLVAATLGFDDPAAIPGSRSLLELGLDSLLALDLKGRLQKGFARPLPTTILFDHPSIDAIVDFLTASEGREDSSAVRSTLVPVQSLGAGRPVVFLPGVLGDVVDLTALGAALGSRQPLHALRSLGLGEGEQPLWSIEEIAAHHLRNLRAHNADGPFLLGGHSFGGMVAYELAWQLLASGAEVPFVAIADIPAGGSRTERDAGRWDKARAAHAMLRMIHRGRPELGRPPAGTDLAEAAEWMKKAGRIGDEAEFLRMLQVFLANMTAMNRYRPPGSVDTKIILIRAETRRPEFDFLPTAADSQGDPTWGWRALSAQPVDVTTVPGDHFTIMADPHVRALAAVLRQRIGRRPIDYPIS
jgi:polyketide synthase 12